MTWNSFHNRGEVLRQAIEIADQRQDGHLPMQAPGLHDFFDDETDLLSALMLKWHTRLMGNVERAMSEQPLDLEAAVVGCWRQTAAQMPGVRAILDRLADEDTELGALVRRAREREHARLAIAAGLANHPGERAARVGASLEAAARTAAPSLPEQKGVHAGSTSQEHAPSAPTFVERIKAVLAA